MFDLADGDAFEGVVAIDRSGYPVWYYNAFEQVMAEWNRIEWNRIEWNGMQWAIPCGTTTTPSSKGRGVCYHA